MTHDVTVARTVMVRFTANGGNCYLFLLEIWKCFRYTDGPDRIWCNAWVDKVHVTMSHIVELSVSKAQ